MKKLIYTTTLFILSIALHAQIKVYPSGYACFGSTSYTPNKPIDVDAAGGIQISQSADSSSNNELYFQDNGQIRSSDNNHRIIFDRANNTLELRDYGSIVFSSGATSGVRTQKVIVTSAGNLNITSIANGYQLGGNTVLWQNNKSSCMFVGPGAGVNNTAYGSTAMGNNALHSNTSGKPNTAFGNYALYSNTTGIYNDAFGDSALYANTGTGNFAAGAWALTANTSGNNNVTVGGKSLAANTTGVANTAMGWGALFANTTGGDNTAIGYEALKNCTGNANSNTALGYASLLSATSGQSNTAIGATAGYSITTGIYNVAVGYAALSDAATTTANTAIGTFAGGTTLGNYNTFVGYSADASLASYTNCAAFGANAAVGASNRVVIGGSGVTSVGGPVAWTNFSDSRIKNNVQENVVGLAFIKKLRPVTYNLDAKKLHDFTHPKSNAASNDSIQQPTPPQIDFAPSSAIVHSGFIAQEVEQAAQAVGYTNSIVSAPANSNDLYALSYAEFVVPLVKAVQELSSTVDSLKQALAACCCSGTTQRTLNNSMGATQQKNAAMPNTSADNGTQAILYQNNPNPFSQTTVVKCFVPPNTQSSSLLVFDMNGALKKTIPINNSGTINITINGGDLTPGMYYYTLLIDGQEVDTKKMILTQ